jgi:hypothetical protein
LAKPVRSVEELEAILSMRNSLSMTKEDFTEFYRSIPIKQAKEILDPLDLLELDRTSEWQKTQLSLSGNQLVIYFLDGYENPLRETHVYLDEREKEEKFTSTTLDQLPKFRGRIIPAQLFFQAFDKLPRTYRLQIVNDPYKLVQWGSSLQRVGLSHYVEDAGVELLFEISTDVRKKLESMYASEIAIEYLIQEINNIQKSRTLQMPMRKDENHQDR